MKAVIRTDSSTSIGSGHLMRCFTLADMLREKGIEVSFVCRELPGNLGWLAREKGHSLFLLPFDGREPARGNVPSDYARWLGTDWQTDVDQTLTALSGESDIDWLIVDHYALDEEWEKRLRWRVGHIMVIDDLANRRHDCDLLLDQNLYNQLEIRYDGLVPCHCKKLMGPQFALLRPEFAQARRTMRRRDGYIRRILVSFGGADSNNVTSKVVEAIRGLDRSDIAVDVVVGAANPYCKSLERSCRSFPSCRLHRQVENMAELMSESDLAIGGGGSTTWERCCLGLPTVFIATAEHERRVAQVCSSAGIGKYLGYYADLSFDDIKEELERVCDQTETVRKWSEKAASLVDGLGTGRVCGEVMKSYRVEAEL